MNPTVSAPWNWVKSPEDSRTRPLQPGATVPDATVQLGSQQHFQVQPGATAANATVQSDSQQHFQVRPAEGIDDGPDPARPSACDSDERATVLRCAIPQVWTTC